MAPARGRVVLPRLDGNVTMVTVLGPMLLLRTLAALDGLDPTVLHPGEVAIEASDVAYVEARYSETVIRGRPWVPYRRVATIASGTSLAVRGEVASRDRNGCEGQPWYAVLPFGYVCSRHVKPTSRPPSSRPALPLAEGNRLPFSYASVRRDHVPAYRDAEAIRQGLAARQLMRGMSLVIDTSLEVDGDPYVRTRDGLLVAKEAIGWMGQGSAWQGVRLEDAEPGPLFGWVLSDGAPVWAEPVKGATVVAKRAARARVPLWAEEGDYWLVGEGEWMHRDALAEVHVSPPPEGVVNDLRVMASGNDQWIDVDTGEQVLVAYRGTEPVYATMVSSGLGSPTPLGNYPVWAKVASMDMANQGYEDRPYMVQGVPWVLLFQGHNALHAAYWHDRFGRRKSHGCVNLAPRDARWVFEWVAPTLPLGWTGYLPSDLHRSVVVHVRDSSRAHTPFTQERPWGPPDREEERKRLEEAEARRALASADEEIPVAPTEAVPPVLLRAPGVRQALPPT